MVAIVTGNGLGLERGSGNVLGSRGQLGAAANGRAGEGLTVNAATGNLVLNDRDEVLIGRGPDSIFSRTYNSLGQATDDNGDNWRLNAQRRVLGLNGTSGTTGSWILRIDWDGSDTRYDWDTNASAYVSHEGVGARDTITISGNTVTWTDGDSRVVETYDLNASGRLLSTKDTDFNTVLYSYDGSGRLSRVTTADGDFTDLTWSNNNLISLSTRVADARTGATSTLTRTRYEYDSSNRLTKVTVDLSPEDSSIADGRTYVTTYSYVGTSKLVASIAQTDGSRVDFSYDGSNRVASFTQWVDATTSRTTTFAYATGETAITDPASNVTTMKFDTAGQLIKLTEPAALSGGLPRITKYTWDAHSNNTRIETYDGESNFTADTANARIQFSYETTTGTLRDTYEAVNGQYQLTRTYRDAQTNRILTSSTYTGLAATASTNVFAAGAMTTRYVYDSELHLRFTISPEGRVTEYRYDAPGNLVSTIAYTATAYSAATTAAEGTSFSEGDLVTWLASIDKSQLSRTDTSYDFRGNASMATTYAKVDSTGQGRPGDGFSREIYVYDQFGNLLSKQSMNGEPVVSATNLADWGYSWLNRTANVSAVNGDPAYKFTAQVTGQWAAAYAAFSANAGDTLQLQ